MHAVLVSVLAMAGPSFESDSDCPSAVAVEAAMAQLLATEEGTLPLAASIKTVGPELRIELGGAGGEVLGTRSFLVGSACDQRATVAAVVIASWQRELRAQLRERQFLAKSRVASPPPPVVIERGRAWNVGTSISALMSGTSDGGLGPSASLTFSVDLGPGSGALHLGVIGGLGLTGEREIGIGSGRGFYRRESFAFGPRLRRTWAGPVWVEPRLLFEVVLLDVRGEGFPVSLAGRGWELAGSAGSQIGLGRHGVGPFLSLDLRRFITRSDLVVSDLGLGGSLPAWELQAGVGICYLGGP